MRGGKDQSIPGITLTLSIIIGGALGIVFALANSWAMFGGSVSAFFGVVFGVSAWGAWFGRSHRIKSKPADEEAADQYWRAFAKANDGLGETSLEVQSYAKSFEKEQLEARDGWALRRVFLDENALGSWDRYMAVPRFQAGKRAETYWAEFDGGIQNLKDRPAEANVQGISEPSRIETKPFVQSSLGDLPSQRSQNLPLHLALINDTQVVRNRIAAQADQNSEAIERVLIDLVASVDSVISELKRNPANLFEVQRLFTYYLPEVGRLLDARARMQSIRQHAQVAEIDAILTRIAAAFAQFVARMHEADIRALDIDLKLLDQSLAAEFESPIGT